MSTELAILDGDRIVVRGLSWTDHLGDELEHHQLGMAAAGHDTADFYVAALCPHDRDEDLCSTCDDEPAAACACNPAFSQECDWCSGVNAERGITPPAPTCPAPAPAWAAAWADPWLDPAVSYPPPF